MKTELEQQDIEAMDKKGFFWENKDMKRLQNRYIAFVEQEISRLYKYTEDK